MLYMGRESLLEMNSSASENEVFRSHEISETPTTYAIVKTAELGHKMRLACESCCIVKASCSESKHSSFSAVLGAKQFLEPPSVKGSCLYSCC